MTARSCLFATLFLLAAPALPAQSPAFEVATVGPAQPAASAGFLPSPGHLRVFNTTLEQMIQAAWHVRPGAVIGGPAWLASERYDVEARASTASTFDDDLVMLRALLADRFQLRFHRETRQLPLLALVPAGSGTKLRPSATQGQKESVSIRPGRVSGTNIPMGHFVSILAAQLALPLVNSTGLTGEFDFTLTYGPDDSPDSAVPSLYAALEEQLGLKLERRKGPVDVMVVDSAHKPGEN